MNNLSKSILNYFATFTETRFNFKRMVNYRWTNNELTLDLPLYPEFQALLLDSIKSGKSADITIKPGQYKLSLSKEDIILAITNAINGGLDKEYLEKLLTAELEQLAATTQSENSTDVDVKKAAWDEATWSYNVAVRKELEKVVIALQEKLLTKFKEENGATSFPPSSFGLSGYFKSHLDELKKIAKDQVEPDEYVKSVTDYFKKEIEDIVLYDLFLNLHNYQAFSTHGTLYIFFHTISRANDAFPLYFIEADMRLSNTEISISFPRNLLLLNVPAINYFKFNRVLTTPRASSVEQASAHLGAIEVFLQSQYGMNQQFILEPQFKEVIHDGENFPAISGRIGFQVVANEDKKLLDYSEIMTNIDTGGHSQFGSFIDGYISGTVPNYSDDVICKFNENYPSNSAKRYMSDGPIPLNNSQKRILLALENSKNKIIVVDGPPGTGKSHTIAALAYKANEDGKTVVVTSHKKEALDVIDRMMTDKFKSLHPQAKPSIVRMDIETGSANNFSNTLTASVVSGATERTLEYNDKAIAEDSEKVAKHLENILQDRIKATENESQRLSDQVEFIQVNEKLKQTGNIGNLLDATLRLESKLDIEALEKFIDLATEELFTTTSLSEYEFIVARKHELHKFIEACEHINTAPSEILSVETSLMTIPTELATLIHEIGGMFKKEAVIKKLSIKDSSAGLMAKITGQASDKEQMETVIKKTLSLQFAGPLAEVVKIVGVDFDKATIGDLTAGLERAEAAIALRKYKVWIEEYQKLAGNAKLSISEMFAEVQKYQTALDKFNIETLESIKILFDHYGAILEALGITQDQIPTIGRLKHGSETERLAFKWMSLHARLSQTITLADDFTTDAKEYSRLKQKELEHKNDIRLKGLNQYLGVMQQLKVSFEGGKRFTVEQAKILLGGISVVIAEPSTLSRHFPMQENLIDVLIIDEASQVSIADSISLILRAKQVVIFGDEYQYGAVSAVNVSTKYSASYFTEIVNAYADDYKVSVSDSAKKELVDEVARDVSSDDLVSDALIRPQDNPGAVLWLKTFNIRTSTLSFAKAIANYTTSLKEHFRSFPEIISYSNEKFYKIAQQELIMNRIRTKPIGETLRFLPVTTLGKAGANINLDEIDTIIVDIQKIIANGFKGTIGVITSFKEQQIRLEEALNERTNLPQLRRDHKLTVWFVGDVQGEERDIVYYSFVENKAISNANLGSIYPVIGGTADTIRSLKMQRLNVGFSRAKDTMVFVHSQDIENFSNTQLGNALKHYRNTLEEAEKNDFFIADESIFDSPKEKELYQLVLNTEFFKINRANIRLVPQFPIGNYLRAEFAAQMPKYRVDFLLVLSKGGKEQTLILEYDGIEFHFKDPTEVSRHALSREFTDYDNGRTLELESYGYHFLRINKFTLRPEKPGDTPVMVLDRLLSSKFNLNQ
ncbi:MAG: AAA domain-containing protein [Candidatus Moraniibacteriota bacterium]